MEKSNDVKYLQPPQDMLSISEASETLQLRLKHAQGVPIKKNKKRRNGIGLASGSRNDLEREQMIRENMPLVYFFAKRMARGVPNRNHQDFEDLVSIGTIGLIKAVDRRNPDKTDDEWRVYLATWIKGCMSRSLKKSQYRRDEVEHLELEGAEEGDKSLELLDFYEMVDMLPDKRQRDLLVAKYVYGRNCADIGRELGISRERTRQIVIKGEETLKEILMKLDS